MNYYCMFLFIIFVVTGLNTSFYIEFDFVFSEIYKDNHWILSYL